MDIIARRTKIGPKSTLSRLFIDGVFYCWILEDEDRGLTDTMTLVDISKMKVHGQTAIPSGRYEVVVDYSTRFKKDLPRLLKVPGFAGIRLHPGNWIHNTEGCPLPGMGYSIDKQGEYCVTRSKDAFEPLFTKIKATLAAGKKVWYTVETEYKV